MTDPKMIERVQAVLADKHWAAGNCKVVRYDDLRALIDAVGQAHKDFNRIERITREAAKTTHPHISWHSGISGRAHAVADEALRDLLNAKGSGESNPGDGGAAWNKSQVERRNQIYGTGGGADESRRESVTRRTATQPDPPDAPGLVGEGVQGLIKYANSPEADDKYVTVGCLKTLAAEIEALTKRCATERKYGTRMTLEKGQSEARAGEYRRERNEYLDALTKAEARLKIQIDNGLKIAKAHSKAERERDDEKKLRLVKEGMLESAEREVEELTRRVSAHAEVIKGYERDLIVAERERDELKAKLKAKEMERAFQSNEADGLERERDELKALPCYKHWASPGSPPCDASIVACPRCALAGASE